MIEIWKAIEKKLSEIAPSIVENLYSGITDSDIESLEKLIRAKLPADFIAFYRVHNGQSDESPWMIEGEELLSFGRIADEWGIWNGILDEFDNSTSLPEQGIKNNWWNPLWIPITYDGAGNHYCLDLDPTEEGNYGQIIRMWHDDDERSLEAHSFKEWISNYKDKLVSGQLVYSEDYFAIVDKDDIDSDEE